MQDWTADSIRGSRFGASRKDASSKDQKFGSIKIVLAHQIVNDTKSSQDATQIAVEMDWNCNEMLTEKDALQEF